MKRAAFILMWVWAFVMIQPVFAYFGGKPAYGKCSRAPFPKPGCSKDQVSSWVCAKTKSDAPVCSRTGCGQTGGSQGEDNCNTEGCNPSLGCSLGNFFIHQHAQLSLLAWTLIKQKMFVTDDNRLSGTVNECWHPPEFTLPGV